MTIGALFVCLAGVFKEFLPHLLRAFLFLFLLWLVVVVHRLVRIAAGATEAAPA
jgi:hypothetical membrane protein